MLINALYFFTTFPAFISLDDENHSNAMVQFLYIHTWWPFLKTLLWPWAINCGSLLPQKFLSMTIKWSPTKYCKQSFTIYSKQEILSAPRFEIKSRTHFFLLNDLTTLVKLVCRHYVLLLLLVFLEMSEEAPNILQLIKCPQILDDQ